MGSAYQELKGNVFQTAISYNIGFFGSIGEGVIEEPPSRIDRRDAIVDQLKNSDADVICLQEVILVWYPTTIFYEQTVFILSQARDLMHIKYALN